MGWLTEDEYGDGQDKSIKDYWHIIMVIAVAILFLAIYHGRLPPFTIDRALFYVIVFGALYWFGMNMWWAWENFSPKLISNPIFVTTDGEFDTVGAYALIIPAIKAFGVYFKIRNKTIIAPTVAVNKRGRNMDVAVRLTRTPKENLPPIVYDAIEAGDYPEPYYMGYLDEESYAEKVDDPEKISGVTKPSASTLIHQIEELNKQVTMFKKYLTDVMGVKEDIIDWWKRFSKKEGFWEQLKGATMEGE